MSSLETGQEPKAIPERRYGSLQIYVSRENRPVWEKAREVAAAEFDGNMTALVTKAVERYVRSK